MSPPNDGPHTLDPGTRLVDRYLLEEALGPAAEGTTYWRAHDELLDRAVGLCLLQGDSAGAQRVLSAARLAAAVTDARFLRVLDANDTDGVVYVVSEWVTASSLADLIADRPLTAGHACDLATEVANALDAAHRAGAVAPLPDPRARAAHQPRSDQGRGPGGRRRRPRPDRPSTLPMPPCATRRGRPPSSTPRSPVAGRAPSPPQ